MTEAASIENCDGPPEAVGHLLLSERAEVICGGMDYAAREVVVALLAERERLEVFEAALSGAVAEAIKGHKDDRNFLLSCKTIRDDAREKQRRLMTLNLKLALRDWSPASQAATPN